MTHTVGDYVRVHEYANEFLITELFADGAFTGLEYTPTNARSLNFCATDVMQPIGAWADIRWNDDGSEGAYYFSFGEGLEDEMDGEDIVADHWGVPDVNIFFFCKGEHDMKNMMVAGAADFLVLGYTVEYKDAK